MSQKLIDLAGKRFGKLTVLYRSPNRGIQTMWRCKCDCGTEIDALSFVLRRGTKKGCQECNMPHGQARAGKITKEFRLWTSIKSRCFNANGAAYKSYGGRGITICARWRDDFTVFLQDVGPIPDGMTLERINNDGNYEPNNCRWATRKEQAQNRRSNHCLTYNGETLTITQWAERLKTWPQNLFYRLSHGWSVKETLSTPIAKRSH